MSAIAATREFVAALIEPPRDPFEGADVLPGSDRASSVAVLDRLTEEVREVRPERDERWLTLTYGVAELPAGGSAEDLLTLADLALMEQKTGRQRQPPA